MEMEESAMSDYKLTMTPTPRSEMVGAEAGSRAPAVSAKAALAAPVA
jgi:hypothetical protein